MTHREYHYLENWRRGNQVSFYPGAQQFSWRPCI